MSLILYPFLRRNIDEVSLKKDFLKKAQTKNEDIQIEATDKEIDKEINARMRIDWDDIQRKIAEKLQEKKNKK